MNKKFMLASIDIILFIILSMVLDIFLYTIHGYNIYLFLIIGFQIVIWAISLITYFNKHKLIYNIGVFVTFFVNIISCYFIYNYNNQYDLINGLVFNKYDYIDYYIYVKKGTTYSNLLDLKDKNIGILDDNYDNVYSILKNRIDINSKKYYSFDDLISSLNDADIQAIIVTDLHSNDKLINSDYRKIDVIRVKYEK